MQFYQNLRAFQRRFILATLSFLALWLLLVPFTLSEIIVGIGVAILVTYLSLAQLSYLDDVKLDWRFPVNVIEYLAYFLYCLIKANIDLARRIVHPQLPINPHIVTVETRLQSALGKLLLANSITLTPGTLTVDVQGQQLQVHWIDTTAIAGAEDSVQCASEEIVVAFEKYLEKFIR